MTTDWELAAEVARIECIETAKDMGMHVSCEDEGKCAEAMSCPFQQHVIDRMRKALEELKGE